MNGAWKNFYIGCKLAHEKPIGRVWAGYLSKVTVTARGQHKKAHDMGVLNSAVLVDIPHWVAI